MMSGVGIEGPEHRPSGRLSGVPQPTAAGAEPLGWFPYIIGALLLAACLFDAIEWLLLTEASLQVFHRQHAVMSIITMLLTMAMVGWLIHRASRPISAGMPFEIEKSTDSEGARLTSYAKWFIQMRWIAVGVASLLVFAAVRVAHSLPPRTEIPLWVTIGGLAACNMAYIVWLRRGIATAYLLHVQVYVDLVCLAVLLQFSGGVENPLLFLTVFHVIIAGILLSRRQCYTVAVVASLLVGAVAWTEWAEVLPHYMLRLFPHTLDQEGDVLHAAHNDWYVASAVGFLTVVLLLVAHFVTTLADRARADEHLARDMAAQAVAERRLLEQALGTTGAGLCVVGSERRYQWISNRWRTWFMRDGSDAAEVALEAWAGSPVQQVFQDGRVRVTERTIHLSGPELVLDERGPRIMLVTTAPLLDNHGHVARVVELAQDITHQKRVHAQLLQAGKLAAVGSLAGNVVHEVNNPIGIISAKGRLLLSDHRVDMSNKVAEEIAKITEAADRVAAIARSLLSFCRPSVGERGALDIRLPVRRAAAMIEHRARASKVVVEDAMPDGLPSVCANSNEVQQVFLNLLLNALDAMPGGGILKLSAREENGLPGQTQCVTVIVEDSGAGMASSVMEKIFDPFFTTKEEGHGTGLGLSICLGIVQSHGGEIDVDSEPGHGTVVAVRLPCHTG